MMGDLEALVEWAEGKGVRLYGIEPRRMPGRGVGMVAEGDIEPGETILVIPTTAARSLETISPEVSMKLPVDMPIHGLLATSFALGEGLGPWGAVLPTYDDFASSVPFKWDAKLQGLLPVRARQLLRKQQRKFEEHWKMASEAFPEIEKAKFTHGWFLVNSRSFYYETPETMLYPWEDRLALLPVADLFNHNEEGCSVEFTSTWYKVTAQKAYKAGEEVFTSYGEHSNDYLLAEYGFILSKNDYDELYLDEYILPKLSSAQRKRFKEADKLGDYVFWANRAEQPVEEVEHVMDALKAICSNATPDIEDDTELRKREERLLGEILQEYLEDSEKMAARVRATQSGTDSQRQMLAERWGQIHDLVAKQQIFASYFSVREKQ